MRSLKTLIILIALSLAGVALAAPNVIFQPNVLPSANNTYDLGSTSPALQWLHGYFNTLCIQGDCRTSWPTGGSGSVGNWFTPQSYGNSTSTVIAFLSGLISNGSTTIPGVSGFVGANNGKLYGFATSTISLPYSQITGTPTSLPTSTLLGDTNTWSGNNTFSNTITGSISGNAGTATALAANGANCSAGNFPLGVDALGAVESCTDAWTEAENTAAAYARFPFTPTTNYGAAVNSTSTPIWFSAGLQASSTSRFVYASTTAISGDGQYLTLQKTASSTLSTMADFFRLYSAGQFSGGIITDIGGGAVSVSSGAGTIAVGPLATDKLVFSDWAASSTITIPTNTNRWIGVDYNGGTPIIVSLASDTFTYQDSFPLGLVTNENGTLYISANPRSVADMPGLLIRRFHQAVGIQRDQLAGGLVLAETGTRNITLSAGFLFERNNRFTIPAIDTSGAGSFDTYVGATKYASGVKQWDNLSYNNGGTLASTTANRWGNLWFYTELNGGLVVEYGTSNAPSQAAAETETLPTTLPLRCVESCFPTARLTFKKGASTGSITLLYNTAIAGSSASNHASLSNLLWTSSGHTGTANTIPYFSSTGTAIEFATSTLNIGGIASGNELPLTFSTPLIRTANNIAWVGLATTSQPASSNLLVSNGGAGVFGVATGTISAGTGISLDSAVRSAIGGALQITNSSPLSGLSAGYPFSFSNPTLSWLGLSTTTNSGMSAGSLYVGSGGIFQTAASSSIFGYTPLNPTRALTVNGTANQITSSAGSQDLSADRTWTLSLPNHVIFPGNFQATNATTTNATSTGTLYVTGAFASTTKFFANGLTSCNGASNALTFDGAGTFGCNSITASGGSFPFTPTTFGATSANSTSTLIGFTNGLYALASSTIGNGTQTGGLTISGGATTTGDLVVNGSVKVGSLTTGTRYFVGSINNVLSDSSANLQSWGQFFDAGPFVGSSGLIISAAGTPLTRTITGTTNQVTVTNGNGSSGNPTISLAGPHNFTTVSGLLQGNGTSVITGITGTAGQFPYYNGTNTLLATSTLFLSTASRLGLSSTTPSALWGVSVGTTTIWGNAQFAGLISSSTAQAATYTVNWDTGNTQRFILNQATNFVINATSSNPRDGAKYILKICQDTTGGRTATFVTPGQLVWEGGNNATTTVASAASSLTMIGMIYDARAQRYDVVASTTATDSRSCQP